jgi:hypothetical protein
MLPWATSLLTNYNKMKISKNVYLFMYFMLPWAASLLTNYNKIKVSKNVTLKK